MILDEPFEAFVAEIVLLGYDRDTATYYAARIGDRPIIDRDGKIIVFDLDGRELARLALDCFENER